MESYVYRCIVSFVDLYCNIQTNISGLTKKKIMELARRMADIANKHHIVLKACAKKMI